MEFVETVRKRRIQRHYKPDPIDREVIEKILDLARRAPSAGYTQGQSFIVVTDPQMRKAVAKTCGEPDDGASKFDPWVSEAPVQIIPCTSESAYHRRYQEQDKIMSDGTEIEWPVPFWYLDIGCSVMVILLGVVDAGLAAGYVGIPDTPALKELLGVPEEVHPVGVIPVGHPLPDVKSPSLKRGRKPLENVVHWGRW